VSNGNYSTGGRVAYGGMTNRVAVDKPLTLRSVNGPQFTMIQGYQVPGGSNGDGAIRCIYLTNAATLSGFTLSGGATRVSGDLFRERSGGGAWCESTNVVLTNCILAFNSATNSGGGIYQGTLNNCTLTNNQTSYAGYGGAAAYSVLNGCLLMRNNATRGGGAYWATLNNCTVALNVASAGGGIAESAANNSVIYSNNYNYYYLSTTPALNYCCTTPLPSGGTGNITSNPLFVNLAAGDLHLQSGSPCINAGNNSLAPTALDLDGAPRIRDGRIDLGAYEFQSGASSIAPAIRIGLSGQNITLAWPLWASNFVLTEASTVTTPSAAWTNTPTVPTLSNGQITVTLQPTNGTLKLYRLLAH